MTMRQTSYASYYTKISAAGGRYDSSLLHLYGTNDENRLSSSRAVVHAEVTIIARIVCEEELGDLSGK